MKRAGAIVACVALAVACSSKSTGFGIAGGDVSPPGVGGIGGPDQPPGTSIQKPVPPCPDFDTCNATASVPVVDARACQWTTAADPAVWCAKGAACLAQVDGMRAVVITMPGGGRDLWLYDPVTGALKEYAAEMNGRFFCVAAGTGFSDVADCADESCVHISPCTVDLCAPGDADAGADAATPDAGTTDASASD